MGAYFHTRQVMDFMYLAGQALPPRPTMPDVTTRQLRATLILEEALETIEALGFVARGVGNLPLNPRLFELEPHPTSAPDLVAIADGVADLTVVATGTALACGIDPVPIQALVDASNLEKFAPGSYRRPDGKWVKPPGWSAPDLAAALEAMG